MRGVRCHPRRRPRRAGASVGKEEADERSRRGTDGSVLTAAPDLRADSSARERTASHRRARRARRPRQDHARRRHAARHRRVPGQPGARRPGHGLQRPGARAGHHDPRQGGRRSSGRACGSTWSTRRATPTSAARSSGPWPWSTASLLLVDAAEGPLPQTRYVLSKALAADLPTVLVLNKVDRHDARPDEVLAEVEELFLDLASARSSCSTSRSSRPLPARGDRWRASACRQRTPTSRRCSKRSSTPSPLRRAIPQAPLQAIVTNLDASDYLGRLAIGRVVAGTLRTARTWRCSTRRRPRARRSWCGG